MIDNSILDQSITERGATGQRELIPAGAYEQCEVSNLEPMELNQKDQENGNEARLKVTFTCLGKPDKPSLVRYVNVKRGKATNPHPKSTHFQILAALFPEIGARVGKSFRDWIGEVLTINVFHKTNDQGVLTEEVVYSPHVASDSTS